MKEAVVDAKRKRLKLGPTKIWTGLVLHHKDIFVSHVLPNLNAIDRYFFSDVNTESFDVLKYAGKRGRVIDQAWFCEQVALTNKLEFLKWAREVKQCEWDEWTINAAADKGNLEMLKYCFSNECPCDEEMSHIQAAINGHLDCLRLLFDKVEPSRKTEKDAAAQATCGGHVEILKYFVDERKISDNLKLNCVGYAALHGRLDCLKYLVEEAKAPLNDWEDIAFARHYEHPECENYLREKGSPEPTDEQYAEFVELRLRRTVALMTTTTRIAAMPFQRCASSSATSCSFTSSSWSAFSGNTRAQLQQKLHRRLPQKRYYSASVSSEQQQQQQQQKQTTSFADLGVPKQIVDLLRNAGIEKPSVAQLAALPELIDLRKLGGENEEDAKAWSVSMPSIAMQSHTGSGKTLAYLIPIFCDILREEEAMEKMDRNQKRHVNDVRAMIVAPSQELAMQIVRTIETVLGPYGKDITQQLIGGANARRQEEGLRKKRPFIVVGTPGRIAEMSRMGVLKTHGVSTLVIDEADDLLASNFRRDMARINEHCGKGAKGGRRTIICSATLKKETMDAYAYVAPDLKLVLADYEMNKPAKSADDGDINKTKDDGKEGTKEENIDDGKEEGEEEDIVEKARREAQMKKQVMINAEEQQVMNRGAVALPPHLQHLFIQADLNRKVDVLRRAVHAMDVQRCLIFVNFGRRSKDVEGKLSARGMPVASLHGDMDKIQRERVLKKFKSGEVRALLVSDLAARGLDIPNCDCVFNLELPTDEVHYVHRAGRTGRMGAPGVVVSISEQKENFVLDKFAQKLGIEIVKASPERGRMNVKGDKATF
ncbi:unnamed protein product [Bathycoccus prasinos]